MNEIITNSMLLTEKSLDFLWRKQSVTLDNIANNDTPNYKAKYVTFEEELDKRIKLLNNCKKTEIREEISNSKINFHISKKETDRADGNNVDVDVESAELARTTLQYQHALDSFNRDYQRLRTVIKGQ